MNFTLSKLVFHKNPENDPIPYDILLEADESVRAIDRYIHRCTIFTLKSNDEIIGVCAVEKVDSTTIEIKNLAVLRKYRDKGVGSWCLGKVEEVFMGYDILVGTGDGSLNALRFYERNGFVKFAIRKNFFIENYDYAIFENGRQLIDQVVLKRRRK